MPLVNCHQGFLPFGSLFYNGAYSIMELIAVSQLLCAMSTGARKHCPRDEVLWTIHAERATAPGHPFYQPLYSPLNDGKFDESAETEGSKVLR